MLTRVPDRAFLVPVLGAIVLAVLGAVSLALPPAAAAADPLAIGETGELDGDRITLFAVGEGGLFCYPRPELPFATPPCAVGEGTAGTEPPRLLLDIKYCVGAGNPPAETLTMHGPGPAFQRLWVGTVGSGATQMGDGAGWRYPGEGITEHVLDRTIQPGTCRRGFLPFSSGGIVPPHFIWGDDPFAEDAVVWQLNGDTPTTPATSASPVPATGGPALDDVVAVFRDSGRPFECTDQDDGTATFVDCITLPDELGSWGGAIVHQDGVAQFAFASVLREPPASLPPGAATLFADMAAAFCPEQDVAISAWIGARPQGPYTDGVDDQDRFGDCDVEWIVSLLGGPTEWQFLVTWRGVALPTPASIPTPTAAGQPVAPNPTDGESSATPAAIPAGGVNQPAGTQDLRPGAFGRSVADPARVTMDPLTVAQSALLTLAVLFLMPFPAQLFNSTLEEHAEEVRGWFAPMVGFARGVGRGLAGFWNTPFGIAAFLLVSASLYALLDPSFGLSAEAAVTLLGLMVGIVVVTVLFGIPQVLAHRRAGDRPMIGALPGTLLVGVACVLVSRLADFQPGYLYGLVIGFAFASDLEPAEEGRTGAVAGLLMLGAALLAWVGLGLLRQSGGEGIGFTIAETVLAAVLVAGLEGLVFGLLPLRFLPGERVYRWNRIVWGALLGVGLFAFFHILINPASGYLADTSRTPLFTILGLLIGFGFLSVAFWGYFRFRRQPASPSGPTATA